jgi:hypothetical protein
VLVRSAGGVLAEGIRVCTRGQRPMPVAAAGKQLDHVRGQLRGHVCVEHEVADARELLAMGEPPTEYLDPAGAGVDDRRNPPNHEASLACREEESQLRIMIIRPPGSLNSDDLPGQLTLTSASATDIIRNG